MRYVILVSVILLTSCNNKRKNLSEYSIDKDREIIQFYISNIRDNDTILGVSVDLKNNEARIIQSNKCNLGVSILKHQESAYTVFYEFTFSELKKENGGKFEKELLDGESFDPNKAFVKEQFGFHNLEFNIDSSNRLRLIGEPSFYKIWKYIFGKRFKLNEEDYEYLMIIADKEEVIVINN